MVVNHSVVAGSSGGPRWYEIRTPNNTPTVYQQGTYGPDSTYRWMGSVGMDKAGDMLLSYSISSGSIHPGLAYSGRTPSDALGTLESENVLLNGTGSQTGHSRWGDYSAMRIDPSDDCTFWFTNQYLKTTGDFSWATHIGSFAFNNCGGGGGGAAVTLTPASLKWGKVLVGSTVGKKKVTVTNSGTAALSITNVAISGDFALVPVKATKRITPCVNGTTVAAGASCIIKVSFTPTQTGVRTGNVTFTDNAPDSPQTVSLTGTGK